MDPDTLTRKETQVRGLLCKGNVDKNKDVRMQSRKRLFHLSHAAVMPIYVTARTRPRVCVQGISMEGHSRKFGLGGLR